MPEAVPPAVRARILATEHWSLLATRSQTWSELMGRITAQLTFASAVLVVLALLLQQIGYGSTFLAVAVTLSSMVLVTCALTTVRVFNGSNDDLMLVAGMNRLRAAYVDLDPGVAPYLLTGTSADVPGLHQTYTRGAPRGASQVLGSAATFMVVLTSLVAGTVVALAMAALGASWTVNGVMGGLVAAALLPLSVYLGHRQYQTSLAALGGA